ncbi:MULTISPECIES: YjdF family protein [Bacillus]|uniref:YjdF family protein n=1 Tax=Bacillus TaxID=1386 RepID=UPI00040ED10B|nr:MULTISPECIES: YjdF family protein [Bacillus]QHZ47818.1 YjdF family protein [Bacillus sp. NSP9.1]WFA03897.1 YjdF family protein [Bacillus sp. HSf4]
MKLTIYHDGQFYVGIIEVVREGKLRAFRHMFGQEPKDKEVLEFVNHQLMRIIADAEQEGIRIQAEPERKINPKRLQRQVAKEMKHARISTKAQEAIKQEQQAKKEKKKRLNKHRREQENMQKYRLKKQKAKAKHRGK